MTNQQQLRLRPVTEQDQEFLLRVYESTRAQELAQVPWSAEQKDAFVKMQFQAQNHHYAAEHPRAHHDIILLDQTPAGRIYLDRSGDVCHILDVTVLPEYRRQGIGSLLLRQILDEAQNAGKAVTIYVETLNPSLGLFERLGFRQASQTGFHLLLRKDPQERT